MRLDAPGQELICTISRYGLHRVGSFASRLFALRAGGNFCGFLFFGVSEVCYLGFLARSNFFKGLGVVPIHVDCEIAVKPCLYLSGSSLDFQRQVPGNEACCCGVNLANSALDGEPYALAVFAIGDFIPQRQSHTLADTPQ